MQICRNPYTRNIGLLPNSSGGGWETLLMNVRGWNPMEGFRHVFSRRYIVKLRSTKQFLEICRGL